MKTKRTYIDYFHDIFDAIEKAEEFTSGMKLNDFSQDPKTQFAVVRALEIIGEAAKKFPDEIRDNYPDIPWRQMSGMRDKLAHDYFGVNTEVVWKTLSEDLPPLKRRIKRIIEV